MLRGRPYLPRSTRGIPGLGGLWSTCEPRAVMGGWPRDLAEFRSSTRQIHPEFRRAARHPENPGGANEILPEPGAGRQVRGYARTWARWPSSLYGSAISATPRIGAGLPGGWRAWGDERPGCSSTVTMPPSGLVSALATARRALRMMGRAMIRERGRCATCTSMMNAPFSLVSVRSRRAFFFFFFFFFLY